MTYEEIQSIFEHSDSDFEVRLFPTERTDRFLVSHKDKTGLYFYIVRESNRLFCSDLGNLFERYHTKTVGNYNIWPSTTKALTAIKAKYPDVDIQWSKKGFPSLRSSCLNSSNIVNIIEEFADFYTECDTDVRRIVNKHRKERGCEAI